MQEFMNFTIRIFGVGFAGLTLNHLFFAVLPNLDLQISRSRIMTGGDVSLNGVEYGGLYSSTDFNAHSLMVVS